MTESSIDESGAHAAHPLPALKKHVRNPALTLLVVLAVIFILHWARAVFIPLMLGVMISYALSPLVNQMEKWRIPRALGAALLMLSIIGGLGAMAYSLSDETSELIESLPDTAYKLRQALRKERAASEKAMKKVQSAAAQIERTVGEASAPPAPVSDGVMRVQIEKPRINITEYLWQGTMGAILAAGQACLVMLLAYFLLTSGDTFRRKLVKISGDTLTKRKITVQVLDEITSQIQRFLLVQIATSVMVGVVSWLAFQWVGLEHPAIWGIAAGVFNSVPYLGPVIVFVGIALVAFLQFGTLSMAFTIAGISLVITSIEGYFLTPWLTGRASSMNAVVVFVGILFWGWLWGAWGLLLGLPIIMIIKAICDHVENFKSVGELLGD